MDTMALFLSRIQFAFTISFHIIFPTFTIGLAAWLTVLEALHLSTGRLAYRTLFDFWLKIFAVAFGMGVVSGIVMAFQFGMNWSVLSRMSGPIQGPLLSYETFTAFMLEATFFGESLIAEQRSLNRSGPLRQHAPVGAELKRHDDPGYDAQAERDRENLQPEIEHAPVERVAGGEPRALDRRQPCRQADREGREDDVKANDETKLQAREKNRIEPHA